MDSLTELLKYALSLLPPGILGAVIVICVGFWLHYSKKVPYKVVKTGVNGHTTVTADALKANCKNFHEPLEKSLDTLVENQAKISDKVSDINNTVSFIKGQLSK